jgi:hypothetical protein
MQGELGKPVGFILRQSDRGRDFFKFGFGTAGQKKGANNK